jgi:hypothetical protein
MKEWPDGVEYSRSEADAKVKSGDVGLLRGVRWGIR